MILIFKRLLPDFKADRVLSGGVLSVDLEPLEDEFAFHLVGDSRTPYRPLEVFVRIDRFQFVLDARCAQLEHQLALMGHVELRVLAQRSF